MPQHVCSQIGRRSALDCQFTADLLRDPAAESALRTEPVGIGKSSYLPPAIPALIETLFDQILAKAGEIRDPYEQAFFVMVHLPYAPTVNPYFDQGQQGRAAILKDITAYRAQWPVRTLRLLGIEWARRDDASTLKATYRLKYTASDGRRNRSGTLVQVISYTLTNGRWLVSGIQTIERVGERPGGTGFLSGPFPQQPIAGKSDAANSPDP